VFGWLTMLSQRERTTMLGCFGGWSLDALDVQIFSFVIPTLLAQWGLTRGEAGVLGTVTLLLSAFGGWIAGAMCDRYGRVRVLQVTVVWYAVFTFLSGFAPNFSTLFFTRAMQGLGFGGEWAAGAVLLGEVIQDRYRGRAVGFVQSGWAVGWAAAALLYMLFFAVFPPEIAWRALFWVGLAPALLVVWIRRHVHDPDVFTARARSMPRPGLLHLFTVLRPPYLATTLKVSLLVTGAQGGSYALSVWLPTYLKTARGISTINTGSYLLLHILGAFAGFITGAYLSDRIGRKPTFLVSAIGAPFLVLIYMFAPIGNTAMLFLGIPLGFFIYLMLAPMGPFMTELFPTAVRGAGQGFCYNAGRATGAVFPGLVGFLSERMELGPAMAVFCFAAYGLSLLALLLLPETRGRSISDEADAAIADSPDGEAAGHPAPILTRA